MARVLAYTSPAAGHLFPLIPILDELSRRGHQIVVRTLAAQAPLVSAPGLRRRSHQPRHRTDQARRLAGAQFACRARSGRCGASAPAPNTTPPTYSAPLLKSVPTCWWSTSTAGALWPPPKPGAGRGPRCLRTRCRCARRTHHHSAPVSHRPAESPDDCVIGRYGRWCWGPSNIAMRPELNSVRAQLPPGPAAPRRRRVPPPPAGDQPDRRALRIPTPGLAGKRRHGRALRLGPSR